MALTQEVSAATVGQRMRCDWPESVSRTVDSKGAKDRLLSGIRLRVDRWRDCISAPPIGFVSAVNALRAGRMDRKTDGLGRREIPVAGAAP